MRSVVATPDDAHDEPVRWRSRPASMCSARSRSRPDLVEADDLLALIRSRPARSSRSPSTIDGCPPTIRASGRYPRRGASAVPSRATQGRTTRSTCRRKCSTGPRAPTPIHFLGAHDIDLMRWYFGSEPLKAYARGVERGAGRARDRHLGSRSRRRSVSRAVRSRRSNRRGSIPTPSRRIVDSFVEVIGSSGHLHFDRKRESIEMSTAKAVHLSRRRFWLPTCSAGCAAPSWNVCRTSSRRDHRRHEPHVTRLRRPAGDRGARRHRSHR